MINIICDYCGKKINNEKEIEIFSLNTSEYHVHKECFKELLSYFHNPKGCEIKTIPYRVIYVDPITNLPISDALFKNMLSEEDKKYLN